MPLFKRVAIEQLCTTVLVVHIVITKILNYENINVSKLLPYVFTHIQLKFEVYREQNVLFV